MKDGDNGSIMNGPIIVFDKSTLQSLSVDETCWLDNFFTSNVTPLFYVETLADLEKNVKGKRTPQQIVGELAVKTPSVNCFPNVHHSTLFVGNLLGFPVRMAKRPTRPTGQLMQSAFGRGTHHQQFPEAEALQRWQRGEFLAIERDVAGQWRTSLSDLSFEPWLALVKDIAPGGFRDLAEVKTFVDQFMQQLDDKLLSAALYLQGVPASIADQIISRWVQSDRPPLSQFAPYAGHVLKIDLFFSLSLESGRISKDRASNKVDMAYLYYLPFTMVFVSNDRLHIGTAPLFMEMDQVFVRGEELKIAFRQLDEYYWGLPDEIKDQGIIRFAPHPPEQCETLVSELWDKFLPSWRQSAGKTRARPGASEPSNEVTVESLERTLGEAMPVDSLIEVLDESQPDYVYSESVVPRTKGKWNILPDDLE